MSQRIVALAALALTVSLQAPRVADALPSLPRIDRSNTIRRLDVPPLRTPQAESQAAPSPCGQFEFALDPRPGGHGLAATFRNACDGQKRMRLSVELVLDDDRIVVANQLVDEESVTLSIPLAQVPRGAHQVTLRVFGTVTTGTDLRNVTVLYHDQRSRTFIR